jgi:RNA polymerase sigma-70 factor (ECF subfamily)
MASIGRPPAATLEYQVIEVNAAPAIVLKADGRPIVVVSVLVADGLIREILFMANPHKLAGMFHRSETIKRATDVTTRAPAATQG